MHLHSSNSLQVLYCCQCSDAPPFFLVVVQPNVSMKRIAGQLHTLVSSNLSEQHRFQRRRLLVCCNVGMTYRTKLGQGVFKGILGLGPADTAGIEDVNCSGLVQSHGDWCKHSRQILQGLGLQGPDAAIF
jgi:hypothetical protein